MKGAPRRPLEREARAIGAKSGRVGRLQHLVRRAFVRAGGRPLQIRDLLGYCYPDAERHPHWHRSRINYALPRFGEPIGRVPGERGRPMRWIPNAELMRKIVPKT